MAEISPEENLSEGHEMFASQVVRKLNKFCSIPVELESIPNEVNYLTDSIYWGVITISFVFRNKRYKILNSLRKGLKNENFFLECCMFIPTERNDRFFFNFLKRVSMIYEMASFCYRNNDNYFETARNCIADFQDKEYFRSAGSWERLDRISNFLTLWSKQLRSLMIKEVYLSFPLCSTTTDDEIETPQEEERRKLKELKSKDTQDGLTSDVSCPIEREREFNSALVLLLADEITEMRELGSIEDEIKSIIRHFTSFLPPRITKCYEAITEDSENEDDGKTEFREPQKPRTRSEASRARNEAASRSRNEAASRSRNEAASRTSSEAASRTSSEAASRTSSEAASRTSSEAPDLFFDRLADEMTSNVKDKISIKARFKELVNFIEETKSCFQESSNSSTKEETETKKSTILEEDLYLSESSNDENLERIKVDKDSKENKSWIGRDLSIPDNTESRSYSDWVAPEKCAKDSLDDADYIKFLEQDLYFEASTFKFFSFSYGKSPSKNTEPYSARNSIADEGESGSVQNNISSSENNESLNIKSENEFEVKDSNRPFAIPTEPSTSASFTVKEDSVSETNNEEQLTGAKSAKSSSSEAEEKHKISNLNNEKPQKRKTKRRKKKGRSKK